MVIEFEYGKIIVTPHEVVVRLSAPHSASLHAHPDALTLIGKGPMYYWQMPMIPNGRLNCQNNSYKHYPTSYVSLLNKLLSNNLLLNGLLSSRKPLSSFSP